MYKFTEDGKGPMHLRFFTVIIDKQKVTKETIVTISNSIMSLVVSCAGPSQLKQLIKTSNQVNMIRL